MECRRKMRLHLGGISFEQNWNCSFSKQIKLSISNSLEFPVQVLTDAVLSKWKEKNFRASINYSIISCSTCMSETLFLPFFSLIYVLLLLLSSLQQIIISACYFFYHLREQWVICIKAMHSFIDNIYSVL